MSRASPPLIGGPDVYHHITLIKHKSCFIFYNFTGCGLRSSALHRMFAPCALLYFRHPCHCCNSLRSFDQSSDFQYAEFTLSNGYRAYNKCDNGNETSANATRPSLINQFYSHHTLFCQTIVMMNCQLI